MELLILLVILLVLGFIVYAVSIRIPDPTIRIVVQLIALLILVMYLIRRFGYA